MSRFNNYANLQNDRRYINCINVQNQHYGNYQFGGYYPNNDWAVSEPGMFTSTKPHAEAIGTESQLTMGDDKITRNKCRTDRQLNTRVFASMPYTGAGSGTSQLDVESQLMRGQMGECPRSRSQNDARQMCRMEPLVPAISNSMRNVDHFVESKWVRGGISSRSIKQSISLAKCYPNYGH